MLISYFGTKVSGNSVEQTNSIITMVPKIADGTDETVFNIKIVFFVIILTSRLTLILEFESSKNSEFGWR